MKSNAILTHLAVLLLGLGAGFLIGRPSEAPVSSSAVATETTNSVPDTPKKVAEGETPESSTSETQPAVVTATETPSARPSQPVPAPLENRPTTSVTALPAADACFSDDSQLSYQLSLFSEELEKKQLWYDNTEPENFLNNSGIFHRAAAFVKTKCDQYDYPPASLRGSVNLADWYAKRKTLTVINSREDALARRNEIRPGAVLFFGKSDQFYNDLTEERVLKTGSDLVITHVGVVTEVKKDAAGNVSGYVMLHGRGDGKVAQRTHYHSIEPAGFGMPPLGNYSQQWVAMANLRTPRTEIHSIIENATAGEEVEIPTIVPGEDVFTIPNTPGTGAMTCFGFDFDDYFFRDVATALENERIPYKSGPFSDCSGIVYRVCNKVSDKLGDGCAGSFKMPCEGGYRDSRKLARWYYDNGNLQVVNKPQKMGDLIQVGSVMFYGQVGSSYSKNVTIEDLEKSGTGIQHVAVVVSVEKDETGEVVSYHLFHGHGKTGNPADITKPSKSKNQYARNDRKAYSYWDQQWVAIAPSILTVNRDNGLTQN